MQTYLGVTTDQETGNVELCCASASDAETLAKDLAETIRLFNSNQLEVADYKIIYRGDIRPLK